MSSKLSIYSNILAKYEFNPMAFLVSNKTLMKYGFIHLTLLSCLLVGILVRFNGQKVPFFDLINVSRPNSEQFSCNSIHSQNYKIQKVVIDPGHGGRDTGCIRGHSNEKHLTLSISKKLGKLLEKHFPNIEFIFTRKKDVSVELHKRSDIANNAGADLFISIHCNSMKGHEHDWIRGAETYVLGLKTKKENLEVVKRENESILLENGYKNNYETDDADSPESHIIFSHYQNEYLDKSILFAQKVQQQFKKIIKSRGVKQANFHVLREISMPGVLIETAYMSNPTDKKFLETESGQDKIANAILTAFSQYKNEVENHSFANTATDNQQAFATPISHSIPTTAPEGVIFKVQLAASKRKLNVELSKWQQIEDLNFNKTDQWYRYYAGKYLNYQTALEVRKKCTKIGFQSAFVVAFKDGKKIKLEKALLKP